VKVKYEDGKVSIELTAEEAETLMDIAFYVEAEARNGAPTIDMIDLAENLGPMIEMALGYNKGDGE